MGLTLVDSAFLVTQWNKVNGNAFRLLVHMARTALDRPTDHTPARRYWRGREAQALALGYTPVDCASPGAMSAVTRAVGELSRAEILRKESGGYNGRTAVYELLLHGDAASADLLQPTFGTLIELSTAPSTGQLAS